MFSVPDVDEVVAVAGKLGIDISADEAALYQKYLVGQLAELDTFVQSRLEESRPPMVSPSREPGYRPGAAEDPLNAWTWKCRIEGPDGSGLLAGKTVSYKDHIAVAGMPMSLGSFALEHFIPDFDATVVTRVLQAGGTIVGKNTMNGLAGGFGSGGGIGDYGRPLNPHDREFVTGGSSAGSGAAVAAREVDISFGGDQGGSIRSPASWSGTVGLKPTFGLISHFGIGFGSDQSIDYTGPMTRTIEDAAAALEATAGYDGYDPRQGRDVPEKLDVMSGLDRGVAGVRIGVLEEGFEKAEDDVTEYVMAAVEVLSAAGATVSKISVPEHLSARQAQLALMPEGARALFATGFFGAFTKTYYPAAWITAVNKLWAHQADLLAPRTKASLILAELSRRTWYGQVYAKAQNVRASFVKGFDAALAEVDVLVMPTSVTKAFKNEVPGSPLEAVEDNLNMQQRMAASNTMSTNYTGHPALAVPVGKSSGLPVSMQLIGRHFDDPLLLQVAAAYQHSVDWDDIVGIAP
jgi:amidase